MKTVESLLRPDRGIAAAQAFFRKALALNLPRWPGKITLDGHTPSHVGLRLLRREDPKWKYVLVRTNRYLNNIVEQASSSHSRDHYLDRQPRSPSVGGRRPGSQRAVCAPVYYAVLSAL